jgi:hypothetical protein
VAQPQNWQNARAAEDIMNANMQPVRRTSAGGLRILEFRNWEVGSSEIEGVPLAIFDHAAELGGVAITVEPTDELTVWLYWRALESTTAPLKVFLHLTANDQIVAQDDQYPQDGRISTTAWEVGMIYRDVYVLPLAGVPPGDYALVVGFYDPETNRRLPVGDGDRFTIQTIRMP